MDPMKRIPWNEFQFEASRSAGPGGQNVNKTNSAVLLRWSLRDTSAFSEDEKRKLQTRLSSKLTTLGEILIRSQTSRDQDQNKKECLRKLSEMLERALRDPKPRKATKPTRSSQRKRVETKRHRSEIKAGRQKLTP